MSDCPNCGGPERYLVSVWEDPEDHRETQPDWVGCTNCHRMMNPRLMVTADADALPPQAELTDHEIQRLPIGNQHTETRLSIIEWQCVKGAAVHYGVSDWTSKVDATLTKDENLGLMEKHGTKNNETTLRKMQTPVSVGGNP